MCFSRHAAYRLSPKPRSVLRRTHLSRILLPDNEVESGVMRVKELFLSWKVFGPIMASTAGIA